MVEESRKWDRLPDAQTVQRAIESLRGRGVTAELESNLKDALELIVSRIPEGSEIMTGASASLERIGFLDLLKSGTHQWKNLKQEIMSEKDTTRQRELRVKATAAQYYLGSVQAVAETGEIVIASASGSQIPAYSFNSPNVI